MIGVDNDPSTFYRPHGSSGSIFLNALMYRELLAMAYLARQLRMPDLENRFTREAEELKKYPQALLGPSRWLLLQCRP